MKIAFCGYDYTLDIAQRLLDDGHDILHIFTFPCDHVFAENAALKNFASYFNIPITESPCDQSMVQYLSEKECQVILTAGYPHKVPDLPEGMKGINFHPALLPKARGIMPLPFVIMHEPEAAGFTLHKMTQTFDTGDIIYQQPVNIDSSTDVETLSAKIALHAPNAISGVFKDLDTFWNNATAQNNDDASHYPEPTEEYRTLSWADTAEQLRMKGRAFGRFGTIATIHNDFGEHQRLAVFNLSTWEEEHNHPAGKLLRSGNREIVVAIGDGYVCLKEFQAI